MRIGVQNRRNLSIPVYRGMNSLYNVNGWQKKLKPSFKIPFSAVLHYNEIHPDAKVFCKPDDKEDFRFKKISDPRCFKNLRKLERAKATAKDTLYRPVQ